MSEPILIVTLSNEEWRRYCRENNLEQRNTKIVRSTIDIQGFHGRDVRYVGRYYELGDLAGIVEYCKWHEMAVPKEFA